MAAALGLLLVHRQALAQTLAGGAPPGPNIPAQAFPPMCSIAPQLSESFPRSTVLTVSDGTHPRCVSVIIPGDGTGTTDALPMPVLFEFHGAGGNARNYGHGADATQTSWAQLAAAHSFVVAGGEALQWSDGGSAPGPPSPGKVPAECKSCFEDAGCGARADCTVCCQENQGRCSQHCMPSHTPFPDAEAAVCHSGGGGAGSGGGGGGRRMLQEGPPTGSCGNIAMRAMGVTRNAAMSRASPAPTACQRRATLAVRPSLSPSSRNAPQTSGRRRRSSSRSSRCAAQGTPGVKAAEAAAAAALAVGSHTGTAASG
jgi:hypothetical protein